MFNFLENKLRSVLHVENFNHASRKCLYFILLINIIASLIGTIFIPGFSSAALELHTTQGVMQLTIVSHLIGEIVGRLLWGPLSDYIGSRNGLIPAITLSILGQIGCFFSTSVEMLIVMRFIQAIGSGVVYVVSLNYIACHFDGIAKYKAYSTLEMYQPIANLTAPILGSFFCMTGGWRSIFLFFVLAQTIIRLMLGIYMPDDKPVKCKASIPTILGDYKAVVKNKKFLVYAIIPGFVVGCYMTFSVHVPEIYHHVTNGISNAYIALHIALIQSAPLCFNLIATSLYKLTVQKYGIKISRRIGSILNVGFMLCIVYLINVISDFKLSTIILAMCIQCISSAFLVPVSVTGAMESSTEKSGILAATVVVVRNAIMSICLGLSAISMGMSALLCELLISAAFVSALLYFRRILFKKD